MSSPIQTIAAALQQGHENCGCDADSIWADALAAWPAIGEVIAELDGFVSDLTSSGRNRATMLTIDHDALASRVKRAAAAIAKARGLA